ncbi:MAG: class I SAM-dependent methyltransferase [Phenylobacterium sp.]|uniref:class I SAM-dependent methyltransferase n=1 Tax=Phenylobacterium sp. TaxID=1871053 RepID=UPI00273502C9|nr:class I SAM-dependent methyltransferase [Phenylobacterium sp.]MDP3746742.1 class I SAM-dependent methyltransferase [Phenylobacterium sp.]
MSADGPKDPANWLGYAVQEQIGETRFGVLKNWEWYDDPKRILFSMSRYKFVAKMFTGRRSVLEVGCGDGFNAPIVRQAVEKLTITDFDPLFIADAKSRVRDRWPYDAVVVDVLKDEFPGRYDGIYSLDMLEHIDSAQEQIVLQKVVRALTDDGAVIIGMPSLESQAYASEPSRLGHINCKSGPDLEALMKKYFHNVFMFSMNDELVHTGYHKMAHYLIALACQKKN